MGVGFFLKYYYCFQHLSWFRCPEREHVLMANSGRNRQRLREESYFVTLSQMWVVINDGNLTLSMINW